MSPETEPPGCRHRSGPGDGAATGRGPLRAGPSPATAPPGREGPGDGGDGESWSAGARRQSCPRSWPGDGAFTGRGPRRAGRSPATAPQGWEGPGDERRRRRVGSSPETEPPLVLARRRSLECVGVIGGMGQKGQRFVMLGTCGKDMHLTKWCNLQSSAYTRTFVLQKVFTMLLFLTSDLSRPCQFSMTLFESEPSRYTS